MYGELTQPFMQALNADEGAASCDVELALLREHFSACAVKNKRCLYRADSLPANMKKNANRSVSNKEEVV